MRKFLALMQAALLVARWIESSRAAGLGRDEALKELTDALKARIDAAVAARRQPDDPGVHDRFDRG